MWLNLHMNISERIFRYNSHETAKGPVVYWMSRDQRAGDNHALHFAFRLAEAQQQPLLVVFCLDLSYPMAYYRHMAFMLKGLEETAAELRNRNIGFLILSGNPGQTMLDFIAEYRPGIIISDFDPLRIKMKWKLELASKIDIPLVEVDAHNVVPCRYVSQKQEFGAYTLRPKINRLLHAFLEVPGELPVFKGPEIKTRWISPLRFFPEILLKEVKETDIIPGPSAAAKHLTNFLVKKINPYASGRNDPNREMTSGLSPYLHFGQISAARVAIEVIKSKADNESKKSFLEELIVRKELSDNYCFYNKNYDTPEGLPEWSKKELEIHRNDERDYVYSRYDFEKATTHDPLWNAAQRQMAVSGLMHGYMRMYWAKKILEWTPYPEKAYETAVYLNDKYSLDGRDPNGYAGIAWAIGGLHDRAWASRPVYGKIRYMNDKGCARKFNVAEYISRWGG